MATIDFRELVCKCVLENALCVFGEDIQYLPKAGGKERIRAIFDNEFEQVDPDTEQVVSSNNPLIGIKLADLPRSPVKGDKVIIREKKYRVIDSQEDGQGGASLLLHKLQ